MIAMEDLFDRIESQVPVVYPGCHFQKSGVFVWVAPDKFPATGCLKQYGGLSYPPIYQRFARHLGTIRDPNSDCTVARHWREPGHTLEHLEFLPVERLGTRCRTTLRQREKDMIARLGLQSAGLNINS